MDTAIFQAPKAGWRFRECGASCGTYAGHARQAELLDEKTKEKLPKPCDFGSFYGGDYRTRTTFNKWCRCSSSIVWWCSVPPKKPVRPCATRLREYLKAKSVGRQRFPDLKGVANFLQVFCPFCAPAGLHLLLRVVKFYREIDAIYAQAINSFWMP